MEIDHVGCPVPYPIRPGTHDIYTTWAFVGFRNNELRMMEFPPCELYINDGGRASLGRITITFTEEASQREEFDDFQTFSGRGPVNSFFGDFRISDSATIESGRIGSTLIASVHDTVNEYEAKFYTALLEMTHYSLRHNKLVITFGEGKEEMVWVLMEN